MAQLIPADKDLPIQEVQPADGRWFSPSELERYVGTTSAVPMFLGDGGKVLLLNDVEQGVVNERICLMLSILPTGELKKLMIANGKSIDQPWLSKDDSAPAYQIYGDCLLVSESEFPEDSEVL